MAIINSVIVSGGGSSSLYGMTPEAWTGALQNGTLAVGGSGTPNFAGVTTLSANVLSRKFYKNTNITGVASFPDLVTIAGEYALQNAFYGCTGLTGVSFPNLASIVKDGLNEYNCEHAFDECSYITTVDMGNVVTIGSGGYNMCAYMFQYCSRLTSFDLSSLKTVNGWNACLSMFKGCSSLLAANLGSVETATQPGAFDNMFRDCVALASFDMHKLQSVPQNGFHETFKGCTTLVTVHLEGVKTVAGYRGFYYAFDGCTSLVSLDLRNLESANNGNCFERAFNGCSNLTTVILSSLKSMPDGSVFKYAFANCAALTTLSFPGLTTTSFGTATSHFNNMLSGCSGVTVHFPMAIQSTIGSWADVTAGFGGTNTTVLFDIVTSLTGADGNTYTRQEKDSTSTATAWVYNDTLYYTSGATEPTVSATIYSDAACTTSVTTISSIA